MSEQIENQQPYDSLEYVEPKREVIKDDKGRFAKGNSARRGVKLADCKRTKSIQEMLSEKLTPEVQGRVLNMLVADMLGSERKLAQNAVKLVWAYLYGQPKQSADINVTGAMLTADQAEQIAREALGLDGGGK